jgi:hypothetical protein
MAPRWIRTKDHAHPPFTAKDQDDWLLLSGDFVVGRVFREMTGPSAGSVLWKLSGLHGLSAGAGSTESVETGQRELLAGWREWQAWAGVRDTD